MRRKYYPGIVWPHGKLIDKRMPFCVKKDAERQAYANLDDFFMRKPKNFKVLVVRKKW